jgi:hypothetical protein
MAPVGSVVACPEVLNSLRPEYAHLRDDKPFWTDLQDLHDSYIDGQCDERGQFTRNVLRPEPAVLSRLTGAQFLEQLRKKYHDLDAIDGERLQNEVGVADGIS